MTANSPDLSVSLERLERKWNSITETPEKPQSTMDIIEYGLGKQQRAEVYVNRLLCYLLDPENPHGMDADFLKLFLQRLPDTLGFDEDTYDLSNVRVDEQVTAEDSDSRKYPDLVLDIPGEWFLLIELKFSAAETGTEFYAQASRIGDQRVEDYESGQYYVYLHQHDEPTASSDAFTNWTWRSFVDDVLDEIITESAPRYPQRTAAQLHELRDDLTNITNMSDEQTADQEKIELFIEHADAIEDVSSTFDDAWESYSERWGGRLAERLGGDDRIGVHSQLGNEYPEVVVSRADTEDERWILRDNGGDWQHLHKFGWYKHEETLKSLTTRASDNNDLRIGFYHRMGKHRDAAVRNHQLHFKFRNMGSNPGEFKDIYSARFDAETDRIGELLSGTNGTLTGNKLTKITATYDIPVSNSDGFFDAYTTALHDAFVDFIVDTPELIQILSETFDEAVDEYHR
jgi:hypothetical protein